MKTQKQLQESAIRKIVEKIGERSTITESKAMKYLQQFRQTPAGNKFDTILTQLYQKVNEVSSGELTPEIASNVIGDYVAARLKLIRSQM